MHSISLFETQTGRWWLPDDVPTDIVIQAMRAGEVFEPEVVEVITQHSPSGSVILDVGSNFGQMAVLFSQHLGPDGQVHAFEADPFVLNILQRNIVENGCENITIHPGAVWHQAGLSLIYPEPDFTRLGSFGSFGIDPNATNGRSVKSLTIDSLEITGHISAIKIDVQGSDLYAMMGAVETIRRHQPTIVFEYEQSMQDNFGTNLAAYERLISNIGYKILDIFSHNYVIMPV